MNKLTLLTLLSIALLSCKKDEEITPVVPIENVKMEKPPVKDTVQLSKLKEMFNRVLYYSQSDAVKEFKISHKKFKEIIEKNKLTIVSIPMTLNSEIDGTPYNVTATYVLKTEFQKIMKK